MSATLYFLPRVTLDALIGPQGRLARSVLASAGLADVLADVQHKGQCLLFELARKGPDGGSGTILIAQSPGAKRPLRIAYEPRYQNWTQAGDKLWVGLDTEYPPQPADLRRAQIRRGYKLPLSSQSPASSAVESTLEIPVLRSPAGYTSLPEDLSIDEGGELVTSVKQEWRSLWDDSAEVWDVLIARKHDAAMDRARAVAFALRVIGVNYRYGRHEQNLLHWLDGDNWQDVLALAVDMPAAEEFQREAAKTPGRDEAGDKKKAEPPAPPSASCSPGHQESCLSIGPAAQPCGSPPNIAEGETVSLTPGP